MFEVLPLVTLGLLAVAADAAEPVRPVAVPFASGAAFPLQRKNGNPPDPDDWFSRAKEKPGSWWPDWVRWLRRYSGGRVKARTPGSKEYPPLEPAPGHYVRQMIRPDKRSLF